MYGSGKECEFGLLITNRWPPSPMPLEEMSVHASITNIIADVSCHFIYNNESDSTEEASFVFPLDSNAAVYHFEAEVNSKRFVAKCRERVEAQATYEAAVESGHTAIFLQESESMGDTFKMKLGNIPPKAKIDLTLKYFNQLEPHKLDQSDPRFANSSVNCLSTFSQPLVLNARYSPNPEVNQPNPVPLAGSAAAGDSRPYKFKFTADVSGSSSVISVTSARDTFAVNYLSDDGKSATVNLASEFKIDHDLVMEIAFSEPNSLFIAHEPASNDPTQADTILGMDCLTVNFLPKFNEVSDSDYEIDSRCEIIFLIDRSGSMSGSNIEQARQSLLLFLKSLPNQCRFQIVGFGSTFASLFPEPRDYTEANLNLALEYQKALNADMGGTEVLQPLESVYEVPLTGAGWSRQIIFLTDGDITNQTDVIALVRRNVNTSRVFAIGIGEGASTALVSGVARAGQGKAVFVRDGGRLQSAVMDILRFALQPRVTDTTLIWNVSSIDAAGTVNEHPIFTVPRVYPPVYSDAYLSVNGLFKNPNMERIKGTVTLNFTISGKVHSTSASIEDATSNALKTASNQLLHRQAAKRQILELTDEHSILVSEQPEKALQIEQKIVSLSVGTNVISKFTSYVGIDPDKLDAIPQVAPPAPALYSGYCKRMPSMACCPQPLGARTKCKKSSKMSRGLACLNSVGFAAPQFDRVDNAVVECDTVESVAVDSSKWAFLSESACGAPPPPPIDVISRIAELQQFNGNWNLNTDLCNILKVSLSDVRAAIPKPIAGVDDESWATAIVLAHLKIEALARSDEWKLLAMKARLWLLKKLLTLQVVEQLLSSAESYITSVIKVNP